MDTNKDGEISKEEFLMAVLPLGRFQIVVAYELDDRKWLIMNTFSNYYLRNSSAYFWW